MACVSSPPNEIFDIHRHQIESGRYLGKTIRRPVISSQPYIWEAMQPSGMNAIEECFWFDSNKGNTAQHDSQSICRVSWWILIWLILWRSLLLLWSRVPPFWRFHFSFLMAALCSLFQFIKVISNVMNRTRVNTISSEREREKTAQLTLITFRIGKTLGSSWNLEEEKKTGSLFTVCYKLDTFSCLKTHTVIWLLFNRFPRNTALNTK